MADDKATTAAPPTKEVDDEKKAPAPTFDVPQDCRLYVSNLKWEITEDELKEMFKAHGEVLEARIVRDRRGWSRGYAFVTFADAASAKKASEALDGKEVQERALHIEIAKTSGPTAPSGKKRKPRRKREKAAGDAPAGDAPATDGADAGAGGRGRGRGRGRRRGRGRGRGRGAAAAGGDGAPAPATASAAQDA